MAGLPRDDSSPYNHINVGIVSPGCHDAYNETLGQIYQCRYGDGGSEAFAWSYRQEEMFRLSTLYTPQRFPLIGS